MSIAGFLGSSSYSDSSSELDSSSEELVSLSSTDLRDVPSSRGSFGTLVFGGLLVPW